jgi:hypothetical protein
MEKGSPISITHRSPFPLVTEYPTKAAVNAGETETTVVPGNFRNRTSAFCRAAPYQTHVVSGQAICRQNKLPTAPREAPDRFDGCETNIWWELRLSWAKQARMLSMNRLPAR